MARLLDHGGWVQLASGIYSIAAPTAKTWLWGGLLYGGQGAVITGRWALAQRGIMTNPAYPIEIYSSQERRNTQRWYMRRGIRRGYGDMSLAATEVALLDEWPHLDEEQFVTLISEALFRRATSPQRLLRAVEASYRIPRRAQLLAALHDVGVGARSPLEVDYLRRVERAHSLPVGKRQLRTTTGFVDVGYEEYGVIVELDGRKGHTGHGAFRDLYRDNANASCGVMTLRYGYWDVRRQPCAVADQVGAVLQSRGWAGIVGCAKHRSRFNLYSG